MIPVRSSCYDRFCQSSRRVHFLLHRSLMDQRTTLSTLSAAETSDSETETTVTGMFTPTIESLNPYTNRNPSQSLPTSTSSFSSPTTETTMVKKRPRLEALRQSLQQTNAPRLQVFAEQTPPQTTIPSSSSSNVVVVNHNKITPSSSSNTTATLSTVATTSNMTSSQIDRIRNLLLQIPDPTNHNQMLQDKHQRFHNYLRISVVERCNLRCTYCMPEQGIPLQPKHQLLTKSEIVHLASIFTKHGVNKFRITGGEPTLRHDLIDIISELKQLPIRTRAQRSVADPPVPVPSSTQLDLKCEQEHASIGMTTNGITLYQHIHEYHAAGLNSVNISLDTLDEIKFSQLTRRPSSYFHNVMKSIRSAINITTTVDPTFVVKINCVIMRHMNDNEIVNFIKLTELYPTVQIRFIEYMPFQENGWKDNRFIPYQEILSNVNQNSHQTNVRLVPIPSNDPNDTTKWYTNSDGHNDSRIGFITSMSQHFCNSCNRLRLTADGQIKVCLFDGSSDHNNTTNGVDTATASMSSISLRDAIRNHFTTNEIEKLIYLSVQKKHAILGGHTDPTHIMLDSNNNRPMTLIGG